MKCRTKPEIEDNVAELDNVNTKHLETKVSINIPCEIGTEVYFVTENCFNEPYVVCYVDSYKLNNDNKLSVKLISKHPNIDVPYVWMNVSEFGKSILLDENEAKVKSILSNNHIHLYQAIARCNIADINFTLKEVDIKNILEDGTLVTKYLHNIGSEITDRFAGKNKLHVDTPFDIASDISVYYSTDKKKCTSFLLGRIYYTDHKAQAIQDRISKFRQYFEKMLEDKSNV